MEALDNQDRKSPSGNAVLSEYLRTPFKLTLAMAIILVIAAISQGHMSYHLVPATLAVSLLLLLYFSLLLTPLAGNIRSWLSGDINRFYFLILAGIVPYWIFANGTDTFSVLSFATLSAYVGIPCFIIHKYENLSLGSVKSGSVSWPFFAAVAFLWLPFDFRFLSNVWLWPAGVGGYSINTLLAVNMAILIFVCRGKLEDVGLPLKLGKSEGKLILNHFLIFSAIAIPIGLDSNFLTPNLDFKLWQLIAVPIGFFFFVAIPEELLFRGIIQNLLEKKWQHPVKALFVTSILFGLSHINNPPYGSLTYTGLAILAGLFYGSAYMRTRNLLAAAIIHTMVDTLWVLYFLER